MKVKKYWSLPGLLLLFAIIMAVYGYIHNGYNLPPDIVQYIIVELFVIVSLFFLLRWQDKLRNKRQQ